MRVYFISPFPPRHDGICEFNQDLIQAIGLADPLFEYVGVAINQGNERLESFYSEEVQFQIRKQTLSDYIDAAIFINQSSADMVCLELEYALYGGFDGKYVQTLLNKLHKKVVVIVHGLPINSYSRRKITRKHFFQEIKDKVNLFITINPIQKKRLESWGIPSSKITNIFHGAPDEILSYSPTVERKHLGLEEKVVIFNFGLFHRKKGIEYLLEALLEFTKLKKNSLLILVGEMLVTDKEQGYLDDLLRFIKLNSLEKHIILINKFIDRSTLYSYLSAADIVVLPYVKRDLVSSGPLSFSALAGKFIITTPFPYAKALLTKKDAYFVRYANSEDIKCGLLHFVNQTPFKTKKKIKTLQTRMQKIKWSSIGNEYYKQFIKLL